MIKQLCLRKFWNRESMVHNFFSGTFTTFEIIFVQRSQYTSISMNFAQKSRLPWSKGFNKSIASLFGKAIKNYSFPKCASLSQLLNSYFRHLKCYKDDFGSFSIPKCKNYEQEIACLIRTWFVHLFQPVDPILQKSSDTLAYVGQCDLKNNYCVTFSTKNR